MPGDRSNLHVRVLVVGPLAGRGGLAAVARQTADAAALPDCVLRVLDTTRPPGPRNRWQAIAAHAGQIAALYRRLRSFRPQVVHLHTCSDWSFFRTTLDILVARWFVAAVVLHVHGGFFDRFLDGLSPWGRAWCAFHLRLCRCIVVLSAKWRHCLLDRLPGLPTAVLPNAVETRRYAGPHARGGNRVLFVGDLAETKGIDDLLRAMARLPDDLQGMVRLRVAGDDPTRRWSALQSLARELGVAERVDWLGYLPADRLRTEYARADVFVLPSRGEGMPLCLLEAMASGLACVVTKVGAVPEIVTAERDARVVRAGDPSVLADAVAGLLRSEDARRGFGRAAAARAAEFDTRRFHPRLTAIWRRARRVSHAFPEPVPVKNSA